ncbi:MAG: hypothetical protein D6796_13835, partial [Caldilineae bacterium]
MNATVYSSQTRNRFERRKREVLWLAHLLAAMAAVWQYFFRLTTQTALHDTLAGHALNLLLDGLWLVAPALLAVAAGLGLARRLGVERHTAGGLWKRAALVSLLFTLLLVAAEPLRGLFFAAAAAPNLTGFSPLALALANAVSVQVVALPAMWLGQLIGARRAKQTFALPAWRVAVPAARRRRWVQGILAVQVILSMLFSFLSPHLQYGAPFPLSRTPAVAYAQGGNTCTGGGFVREYNVSAIHVDITLNNFGDHDPLGYMYVLDENIPAVRAQEAARKVTPGLRDDPIQPLVIRANLGDCLVIHFTNRLNVEASLSVQGIPFSVDSAGSEVGYNADTIAAPSQTITYRWSTPTDAAAEGAYYFRSHGASRQQVSHGLFGALVLEPAGSIYLHPETRLPLASGWEAIIQDPNGVDFREFVILFHEIGDEDYKILDKNGDKLPVIDPLTKSYRPASRALNYRSEPFRDRFKLLDDAGKPFDKAHGYSSYAYGDPATPIPRSYLGEPTKTRIVHGGSELFHVYHLHGGGIRWRRNPKNEPTEFTGGLKKIPTQNAHSTRLDSQGLGPAEAFTLEHECGAGGCQQSAGDFLWHCHIGNHYVSGMWSFWRVYDTRQPDLAPLPDQD